MLRRHPRNYCEPVTRAPRRPAPDTSASMHGQITSQSHRLEDDRPKPAANILSIHKKSVTTFLKPGHKLSYAGLLAFTVVLYARPSEFYPSPITASIALVIGIVTLAFFIPTQLS